MFDKLKKVNQLRKIRNSLKNEKTEVEKDGVRIVVNGEMKVQEVEISSDLTKKKQEDALVDCIQDKINFIQDIS